MSEEEVRSALMGWNAAKAITTESAGKGGHFDDPYQRGLAEGYTGALEMVLRG